MDACCLVVCYLYVIISLISASSCSILRSISYPYWTSSLELVELSRQMNKVTLVFN